MIKKAIENPYTAFDAGPKAAHVHPAGGHHRFDRESTLFGESHILEAGLAFAIGVAGLATIVLGITSYQRIPADLLPIFETPGVQIITFYPGMPPEVMERDIMSRLERWTGQSVGIEHQEGKAMLGVSIVKDFFREGISLETAMSQVTSYAVSDMFYLPPGTIPPMVMPFDPTASLPLCLVSVSSPTMNEKELYDIAYFELRNRLQSIQGVIAPAVYVSRGKLRRILAYVKRGQLEARGLSPMDVVRTLKEQNVFIPAGNMKIGDFDYQIFANSMPRYVEELNDMPIGIRQGAPIMIRDVAEVKDSSQIQTNVVRINGRRQVYIPIYRQPGANTIEIVNAIRRNLDRILQRLREMDPRAAGLVIEVVLDQSVYVRNSLSALQLEGLWERSLQPWWSCSSYASCAQRWWCWSVCLWPFWRQWWACFSPARPST